MSPVDAIRGVGKVAACFKCHQMTDHSSSAWENTSPSFSIGHGETDDFLEGILGKLDTPSDDHIPTTDKVELFNLKPVVEVHPTKLSKDEKASPTTLAKSPKSPKTQKGKKPAIRKLTGLQFWRQECCKQNPDESDEAFAERTKIEWQSFKPQERSSWAAKSKSHFYEQQAELKPIEGGPRVRKRKRVDANMTGPILYDREMNKKARKQNSAPDRATDSLSTISDPTLRTYTPWESLSNAQQVEWIQKADQHNKDAGYEQAVYNYDWNVPSVMNIAAHFSLLSARMAEFDPVNADEDDCIDGLADLLLVSMPLLLGLVAHLDGDSDKSKTFISNWVPPTLLEPISMPTAPIKPRFDREQELQATKLAAQQIDIDLEDDDVDEILQSNIEELHQQNVLPSIGIADFFSESTTEEHRV